MILYVREWDFFEEEYKEGTLNRGKTEAMRFLDITTAPSAEAASANVNISVEDVAVYENELTMTVAIYNVVQSSGNDHEESN